MRKRDIIVGTLVVLMLGAVTVWVVISIIQHGT
jgi:hypothetical protein